MQRAVRMVGLGRYLPARVVHNAELAAACGLTEREVFERSGVSTRHRADQDAGETASFMGAQAARDALRSADLPAEQLDLILNASGTPEQAIPDNGPLIQRQLGLGASGIPSMSVHATCLSFVAALDIAASFLASGRYRRILIVSSEVTSTGLDPSCPETAPLFGDGAAAAVVSTADDGSLLHAVRFETYGEGADLTRIAGCGSRRAPLGEKTRPDDNVFAMNGTALLKLTLRRSRGFLERFSSALAVSPQALLVPHQPSRAGMHVYAALGFAPERTISTLAALGNCVAASIPLSLYEAARAGRMQRGDDVLILGSSAGVSFGAAYFTY